MLRVLHSLSVWGQPGGALESFSREEKLHCLKAAYKARVRNTEMESAMFIALCRFCGLKGKLFMKASGPVLLFHEVIFTSQEKKKGSNYILLGVEPCLVIVYNIIIISYGKQDIILIMQMRKPSLKGQK